MESSSKTESSNVELNTHIRTPLIPEKKKQ
jgi:hypothetical protein